MEMRKNNYRKPGQPKSHSTRAVPLNRQQQALIGTYKSRDKEEHERKIKIGQKNLLQRMKSDDSEFSVTSCDGIATSKVERCEFNSLIKILIPKISEEISAEIRTKSFGRISSATKHDG